MNKLLVKKSLVTKRYFSILVATNVMITRVDLVVVPVATQVAGILHHHLIWAAVELVHL